MTAFLPLDHLLVEHEYSTGNWQDFTDALTSVSLTLREFDGRHTAAMSFYKQDMDPARSSGTRVVKRGDTVRIHMNNASAVSRKTATMTVKRVSTAIDLKKAPGRRYLTTIQLHGKGVVGVAGVGAAKGVDTAPHLSDVITGAAFEIGGDGFGTGRTTPIGTSVEVAHTEVASELDQILTTKDSNPGLTVFEDPEGAIQIFDDATERTGAATVTIGPDNYSDIDMRFDMSHIINVLHIKYLEKVRKSRKHTRIVEHDHTYVDTASRAKYGPFKKTVKVHKKIDFADYADKVFDRNADPEKVPASVTIPVRRASELRGGYEDGHYVAHKVDVLSPDGLTTYTCRVSAIQHSITNRRWLVKVFLRPPSVVRHRRRTVDTEIGHNPRKSLQRPQVDFPLQDHVDPLTVATTGDQTLWTTYLAAPEAVHLRWNGQSQPTTEYTQDGYRIDVADPDNFLTAGDLLEFHYFYTEPTSIGDVDTVKATAVVASLDVPIGTHADGDTILLFSTRGTAPDPWELLAQSTDIPSFRVYRLAGDGTETSVTITSSAPTGLGGEGTHLPAGATVILTEAPDDLAVSLVDLPWSAGQTYAAPALVDATPILSVGVFDGIGDPPDEHITAVDTESLFNMNVDTGLYGIAGARGAATFTTTAGDNPGSHFSGVTIGIETP